VSEEEKSRLARELHDEMGANLTAIGMDLTTVGEQLRASHPELADRLARARKTLVDTVQLKRRIIENLRPSLLDNMGLAAALLSYCSDYARVTAIECDALVGDEVDAALPMQAIALFRITQEALNNVAKYAGARHVTVHLAREESGWSLEVADDGVGIAADAFARSKSHGLLGMRERALQLGGVMNIRRGRNDTGTCIEVAIPLRHREGMTPPPEPTAQERRANMTPTILPPAISDVISSALHPGADGQTPSSPPYSTHPHTPPSLSDQAQ
jgi:signal transduction histidine kinase